MAVTTAAVIGIVAAAGPLYKQVIKRKHNVKLKQMLIELCKQLGKNLK
jgi:Tfp pilus assembly major pilin PilA